MARLPFNSDRVPPPPKASGPSSANPLTVTQVAALVRGVIANHMPAKLRVVGEVSNLTMRGHCFFSLKDDGATIRCVAFASSVRRWSFPLSDGMQVIASGRIDYYDAQGSLQLYVDALEPVGQGTLELRFRALCEELRRLNYFDEERKKPLPVMPACIAVVTSRTGAALHDVINTASRRWQGCRLLLYDVRVQGAAAAPEIAAALNALSRHGQSLGIDAIILTRGGGSMEDLWAFNERIVADAVYNCRLPVVAAIGHETDTTIAELVADRRCSTPTQAAMTLIPERTALAHQVAQLAHRLTLVLRRRAEVEGRRLDGVARHPIFRRPERMFDPVAEQLKRLGERLYTELPRRLRLSQDQLRAVARQLEAVGPLNVLRRGYSYTLGPDGRVLLEAAQVKPGDAITSVLAQGRVASRVERAGDQSVPLPRETGRQVPASPRRKRKPFSDTTPGLFDPR